MSARCLYNCRLAIINPVFLLFGRSLSESTFSPVLKICFVMPVPKTSDPSDVANYRPISIVPHLAKLSESLVYSNFKRNVYYIIINEQHSFTLGKSTVTSSVILTTHLLDSIEKSG